MLIVGLVLGPAVGLLLQDLLAGPAKRIQWILPSAVALVLIVVLSVPVIDLSLRLGLATGMVLGLLLGVTPDYLHAPSQSEGRHG
jgi:class 3 adenylate cyclase